MEDKKEEKKEEERPENLEECQRKLQECEKKRDEYLDGWQRARAEFSNYKKDEYKRFDEVVKTSNLRLTTDLIRVLDSFDLSLAALEKEGKAEKGMYLIRAQLEDVLKGYGLERMRVSVGDKFDPNLHDAVASVESEQEDGTVVEEVEKGYLLYGRVIRPARVKVAKKTK